MSTDTLEWKHCQKSKKTLPLAPKKVQTPEIKVPEIPAPETPELFCTGCYETHESRNSLQFCKSVPCEFCQLPFGGKHQNGVCIVAVCDQKAFGCGKRGHTVDHCVLAPPPCKFCFVRGHDLNSCEKLKNHACTQCHEKGHSYKVCPKKYKCNYCVSKNQTLAENKKLDIYHKMFEFDGGDRLINCEELIKDRENGSYICKRCGYSDCYLDCAKHTY